nr:hypothetical protein [Solirubrobacterales bacterium]
PLASPGAKTLLLTGAAFGAIFGVLDVALPAFAVERESPGASGLLLAALSPGVVAGGYLYGRRAQLRAPGHRYRGLCLLAAGGLVPLAFADSIPALLALTAIAGAAFAPVTTCQWALIDVVAPAGTAVETTSWLTTAYLAGGVTGTAAGAFAAQHASPSTAFWLAVGIAVIAAAIATNRRSTLLPPVEKVAT